MATDPSRFTNTRCVILDRVEICPNHKPLIVGDYKKIVANGGTTVLYPNYHYDPSMIRKSTTDYFLVDQNDAARIKQVQDSCRTQREEDKKTKELVSCLAVFCENYHKQFYLRMFPTSGHSSEKDYFTSALDLYNIIPLVMKQQGTPLEDAGSDLVKTYRDNLAYARKVHQWFHLLLPIGSVENVLGTFNIDKTQIMLVPDPHTAVTSYHYTSKAKMIRTVSSNFRTIASTSQTLLMVFNCLATGFDWNDCSTNDRKNVIRLGIIRILDKYHFPPREHKHVASALRDIKDFISKHSQFYSQQFPQPYMMLQRKEKVDMWPLSKYFEVCKELQLPCYKNTFLNQDPNNLPVWLARIFLCAGAMDQLFGNEKSLPRKQLIIGLEEYCDKDQFVLVRGFFTTLQDGRKPETYSKIPGPMWSKKPDDVPLVRIPVELENHMKERKRCPPITHSIPNRVISPQLPLPAASPAAAILAAPPALPVQAALPVIPLPVAPPALAQVLLTRQEPQNPNILQNYVVVPQFMLTNSLRNIGIHLPVGQDITLQELQTALEVQRGPGVQVPHIALPPGYILIPHWIFNEASLGDGPPLPVDFPLDGILDEYVRRRNAENQRQNGNLAAADEGNDDEVMD